MESESSLLLYKEKKTPHTVITSSLQNLYITYWYYLWVQEIMHAYQFSFLNYFALLMRWHYTHGVNLARVLCYFINMEFNVDVYAGVYFSYQYIKIPQWNVEVKKLAGHLY